MFNNNLPKLNKNILKFNTKWASGEYFQKNNISETQFMLQFTELFDKDMKYFLSKSYKFDENIVKLIKIYEEFLVLNKGFVESEYNTDIILPSCIKTDDAISFKAKIEETLKTKDLSKFLEYLPTIM